MKVRIFKTIRTVLATAENSLMDSSDQSQTVGGNDALY